MDLPNLDDTWILSVGKRRFSHLPTACLCRFILDTAEGHVKRLML